MSDKKAPQVVGLIGDRVWCNVGVTKNLGNYNSLKVDVGMASDIIPEEETLQEAKERVLVEVLDYLNAAVEAALQSIQ